MFDLMAIQNAIALLTASLTPWLIVIPGMIVGLVFGAIPGLQISMAMAIFLPMTLYMNFLQAMLFLTAIFTGGSFGSGVTAILMNIPGTSSAIATAFDGYPMARQGKHNEALGIALGSSTFGVALGYILLFTLIKPISTGVLKLGPLEMFVIIFWGITLIASLSGTHMRKGLASGFFGLLVGTIGFSDVGVLRGAMGVDLLLDGVPVVPAMMGMFAASELFNLMNAQYLVENKKARKVNFKGIVKGFQSAFKYPLVLIRGAFIGVFIGAVPGVGSSVSNILSYVETRRHDKDPDSFGKGNPKGVVASESANSTSEAGSMATLLALGIPGGGATAVMLAAFAMHNITGGPQFIREQTDIVYAIILANFGQVFLLMMMGFFLIPILALVVKVPVKILIPSVLSLAVFGSFGLTGNMSGPYTTLVFAILGWVFKKYHFSVPGTVIGILLGKMAENELVHCLQISGGNFGYILQRPISIVILLLMIFSMAGQPLLRRIKNNRKLS